MSSFGVRTSEFAISEPPRCSVPSCPTVSSERRDRWLAQDKFWHLSASFATVGAAYHLAANRMSLDEPVPTAASLTGTFALGLTKEMFDRSGPARHFSWKDMAANLAGIGLGYLVFIHRFQ